jgi:hypothetical protein
MPTALRSVGLLDILSSMPAGPSVALAGILPDAPCIHARLRRLATKPGEKCGLGERGAWRCPIKGLQSLLQRYLKTIGQERHKNMCFDSGILLMIDGPQRKIRFEVFECLLNLDKL